MFFLKTNVFSLFPNGRLPTSAYSLLIANSLPIVGVLYWGWDVYNLLFLYWSESATIGLFCILKMILAPFPEADKYEVKYYKVFTSILFSIMKLLYIPFFCLHFGVFMLAHGYFLFLLASGGLMPNTSAPLFPDLSLLLMLANPILPGIFTIFLSHAYSFVFNFIIGDERKGRDFTDYFFLPYNRIIVMQLTILFGFVLFIGSGHFRVLALIIFVVIKTIADLYAHLKERVGLAQANIVPI